MNIFLDIETIPDQRAGAYDKILADIKPPGQYKKQESIDKWMLQQGAAAAQEQYEKTGLDGISGEIISISWAIGDGEIIGNCRRPDTTEAWLLQHFFDCIAQETQPGEGAHPRLTWIGHCIIDFDLRFLKQRAMVNNIRPPFILPADARHGSEQAFDTMKEWAGYRGYVKQDELVKAFGIKSPAEEQGNHQLAEMDGSNVWPLYQKQEYDFIQEYNMLDVWKVREIFKRMTWA